MKSLKTLFLLFLLLSCQEQKFAADSCWQKPDEAVIFKIDSQNENALMGRKWANNQWGELENLKSISKNFIATSCPFIDANE
jgi:hypothetical protein